MPMRWPGRTSKLTSRSTQSTSVPDAWGRRSGVGDGGRLAGAEVVYENQTFSKRRCPAAGDGRRIGRAGGETAIGSSSRPKMRSEEAIAACRMLNFSDMSLIGRKKGCEYWMKEIGRA